MMSSEADARELDATDDLPTLRDQFHIPPAAGGLFRESAYLAGNSLGLQHRSIRPRLNDELDDWARLGVEGHLEAKRPWLSYHELLRAPAARLVGAAPAEVVMMNSLTVNLHLMMTSFYRPTSERFAIVIEDTTFPSDSYAVRSQVALHGYDPDSAVIRLRPRDGESALRTEDVVAFLEARAVGSRSCCSAGSTTSPASCWTFRRSPRPVTRPGAVVGWDLAHAAGNVPLQLHDWDVDWAAWCTYKYLNAGPGLWRVASCTNGIWPTGPCRSWPAGGAPSPATRFAMAPVIDPVDTADSWQLSNPPILAMAPVLVSLEMFDAVGMAALRAKSMRLTGYLESLLDGLRAAVELTPRDRIGGGRNCRSASRDAAGVSRELRDKHGVIADAPRARRDPAGAGAAVLHVPRLLARGRGV